MRGCGVDARANIWCCSNETTNNTRRLDLHNDFLLPPAPTDNRLEQPVPSSPARQVGKIATVEQVSHGTLVLCIECRQLLRDQFMRRCKSLNVDQCLNWCVPSNLSCTFCYWLNDQALLAALHAALQGFEGSHTGEGKGGVWGKDSQREGGWGGKEDEAGRRMRWEVGWGTLRSVWCTHNPRTSLWS
jgi:hypothetical protein